MEPLRPHPSPLTPLAPRPRLTTALAFAHSAPSRMRWCGRLLTRARLRRWRRLRAASHTPHSKLRLSRSVDSRRSIGAYPMGHRDSSAPPWLILLEATLRANHGHRPEHGRPSLIGAWHLAYIEAPGPDGKPVDIPQPKGILIYTLDGHMSVQLIYPESAHVQSNGYV